MKDGRETDVCGWYPARGALALQFAYGSNTIDAYTLGGAMAEMTRDAAIWGENAVGPKPVGNGFSNRCSPLSILMHVTHVDAALTIAAAGKIEPGLVYDTSCLNTERLPVVWISPNDWTNAGGSRYGNVVFEFNWADVIAGRNIYWIEVVRYQPLAFRLLVTTANLDGRFERYDPVAARGPWRRDPDGSHHWNGDVCLEVMFAERLSLDLCNRIQFIKHHQQYCKIDYNACPDRNRSRSDGGALFVAGAIARRIPAAKLKLTENAAGIIKPTGPLLDAWSGISMRLARKVNVFAGTIPAGSEAAKAIATSTLAAIAADDTEQSKVLSALFPSEDVLIDEVASVVEHHFGIDNAEKLSRD